MTTSDNWIPPLQHGLSNSEKIIPSYYLNSKGLIRMSFFETIEDSVRNLRELTSFQKTYLKNNPEQMFEILLLYDKILKDVVHNFTENDCK
jgi:hypothetical protein